MVCPGARVPALRCVAPRPVYRGQGPSGAGATAAQGGYLPISVRLPVVLSNPDLSRGFPRWCAWAHLGTWVYRARPHRAVAQGGGGWHAAHPFYSCLACLCMPVLSVFSMLSVLSFCVLSLTVLYVCLMRGVVRVDNLRKSGSLKHQSDQEKYRDGRERLKLWGHHPSMVRIRYPSKRKIPPSAERQTMWREDIRW